MRKYLLFTLSLLLASCQQNLTAERTEDPESPKSGILLVNLILPDDPATKVSGSDTDESAVRTLQIFVFKDVSTTDPTLNVRETDKWISDGSTALSLNTYTGLKRVWALVNAPRQSFENEYALLSHYSMLEENSPTALVMTGSTTGVDVKEYNSAASVGAVTPAAITVSHLGARISVRNVKVDFTDTALEGCTLDVKEVYVLNAVNSVGLDGTARTTAELGSSANWYNLEAWNESLPDAACTLLGDRGNLGISIGPNSGKIDLNRYFYVYPNMSTGQDDTGAKASPRLTRVILHGFIRGEKGRNLGDNEAHSEESYYCFDIPKSSDGATLERNHTYDIADITITMPGGPSDAPGDRPKFGKIEATVTVSEWGGNTTLTYEL